MKSLILVKNVTRFSRKDDLNMHRLTHTGEMPYVFEVCNKGFSKRNNFNKHRRTHN